MSLAANMALKQAASPEAAKEFLSTVFQGTDEHLQAFQGIQDLFSLRTKPGEFKNGMLLGSNFQSTLRAGCAWKAQIPTQQPPLKQAEELCKNSQK